MKIRAYPASKRDRLLFWLGVVNGLMAIASYYLDWPSFVFWICGAYAALVIPSVYVFQDEVTQSTELDEYAKIISQVTGMSEQLGVLGRFLEEQRQRIAVSETTLAKLNDEKAKLEPIILTQKETVEAILAAQALRSMKDAWKERVIGLFLGILASVLASIIYEYFKH